MSLKINPFGQLNLSRFRNTGVESLLRTVAGGARGANSLFEVSTSKGRSGVLPEYINIRIQNPIAVLGNKLLSGAGKWLENLGKNIADFGARLQGQPRYVKGVPNPVTVPPLSDRSRLNTMQQVTAGSQRYAAQSARDGAAVQAAATQEARAFFSSATSASGEDALAKAGDALFAKEDALFKQMADLAASDDPKAQGKLLELQAKLQKIQRLISMITNMMMSGHETKKSVIQNIRP